ncbi:MAG: LysM peptidoglycan-binding domain-containing protein [Phycisphaerales bacterium]
MTVGMKVSLVVLVLFGAVLAFYYGLGTSKATRVQNAVEPAPLALQAPKAPAPSDVGAGDYRPRLTDIARTTEGVLSESVQRAIGRSPQPRRERSRPVTGRLERRSEDPPPRQTTASANSKQADADRSEPEVPANDPLAKSANALGPTADLARTPSTTPRTTPARTVPYTVKENDSLWTIADTWFGDAGRWNLIAKANPLIDPDRLKPGQVLRLPPKNADRRRPERRMSPNEPNTYTIRPGDSLWRIAKAQYGDHTKWSIIYDANRATIGPDPARLTVGRSLRIPPQTRPVGR